MGGEGAHLGRLDASYILCGRRLGGFGSGLVVIGAGHGVGGRRVV